MKAEERRALPGPEQSFWLWGPYLKRVICGGGALGWGFEELRGGERGQRHRINTLPVPSAAVCCESPVRAGRQTKASSSRLSIQKYFSSRARHSKETNGMSPESRSTVPSSSCLRKNVAVLQKGNRHPSLTNPRIFAGFSFFYPLF